MNNHIGRPLTHSRGVGTLRLQIVLAIVLVAFACACSQALASIPWSNGCDSTSGWTLFNASCTWPTLVTTNVHSGTGAWKFNNTYNRIYQSFSTTSGPVALRVWLYDSNTSYDGGSAINVDIRTSSTAATSLLGVGVSSSSGNTGRYDFRILGGGGPSWVAGSVARSVGWHRFDMYYSGSGNSVACYVDGVSAYTYSGLTSSFTFGAAIVGCGASGSDVSAYDYRCDTMAVLGAPTRVSFATSGTGTTDVSVGGTAFAQKNGYYDTSETLALTATPGPGYQFMNWTSTGGWTSPSSSVNYTPEAGNPTVTANFVNTGHRVSATICPLGGGTVTGANWYDANTQVTVTATPNPGYNFTYWSSDACGGPSLSTNASYSFTMPDSDVALYANFAPRKLLTTTACPSGGSTTSPVSAYHDLGDPVTVTATVNPGYTWQYWTDDSCAGTHVVSTDQSYSFSMPNSNLSLYAHLTVNSYNLSRTACSGGAVGGPSGPTQTFTPVTVTATPDPGYKFLGWSADACGSPAYVSINPSYTFNMPPNDYSLYANFAVPDPSKGLFVETFESYSTGGTSFDSIDKNDTVGPNQAANGTGNPWWGSNPPNGRVNASAAHWGTKCLWGTAGGCKDLANLQFRANGGAAITGSVYLDWWFYDPFGPNYVAGSTPDFCGDYTALSYYSGIPTGTDYPSPVPNPMTGNLQQLAIGMSDDLAAGYDGTKYQVRIVSDALGYHSGWSNTPVGRSIGWHHARVAVGPRKPSNTNDITFYIDNMGTPAVGPRDSVTASNSFNIAEANTIMPVAGSCAGSSGCLYSKYFHFSSIDDICFGAVPLAASAAPTGPVGTDQITWNWLDNSSNENGFDIWDAASAGSFKGTTPSPATSFTETGLIPNTNYSRWVAPYITQYCGNVDGPRVGLQARYTLALPPVYGTIGDAAISCNNGQGSNPVPYPGGTPTTFTAINGFGTGPARASKYLYIWDTSAADPTFWGSGSGAAQWTSGTLTETPSVTGSYYMHLRACNGDGVANTTTLTLGPYTYQYGTPVSKISDLWPLPNGPAYALSGKIVSALWSDGFWIEEIDRTAGIKVIWSGIPAVGVGHLVDVAGVLSTGDERLLTPPAGAVTDNGAAPMPISPLGAIEQYVGGAGVNSDTPAILSGKGIYSVGLLVRIGGIAGDAGADFFYLDDGSGLTDGAIKGMKVICGSLAPKSSGAQIVTGVVGVVGGKPVIYAIDIHTP